MAPHTLVIPAKVGIQNLRPPSQHTPAGHTASAASSRAALGTGLRRYDGVGAPIKPGGASHSSFRRRPNPDRRLDVKPMCAGHGGRIAVCGLPPSSVHQTQTPYWVPAFAGTTKLRRWRLSSAAVPVRRAGRLVPIPPLLRRHDGLEGPMPLRISVPAPTPPPPEARPPQAHPSSFRRRPESRSAPGYEPMCAAGTAARSSRLWPYHRRACIHLKRRTGYRPSPVRRN